MHPSQSNPSSTHPSLDKKDGVELAARFSYITNSLRYCGPEIHKEFLSYIEHPETRDELRSKIRDAIKRFESLAVYLEAIAKKHDKDFLDYDVVEAYWIGNSLLDAFTDDDIRQIIHDLTKRGLPPSLAQEFIEKLPHGFKPNHNFHVLYVGVGNVAGTVKTTIQTMDNCRISEGKVLEIIDDKIVMETTSLNFRDGSFVLEKDHKIAVVPSIIKDIRIGDHVALHWGFVCTILTAEQHRQLHIYMDHNLQIKNSIQNR